MAEADPWGDFEDAEPATAAAPPADPWADFEDAPRSKSQRRDRQRAKRLDAAPTPPPVDDIIVRPRDGDTLDLKSGNALRLWGIDAPELKQQGWDRAGHPVPIGAQSRNALADLTSPESIIGSPVGSSFGRTVAPVTTDGLDVGGGMVRGGNALAAPTFLDADPQRRFEYMQAERLARQNRLGVHDTYHQTPEEFRREPVIADRETVAQFWDTPTPFAGMRPEDEAKYVNLLDTSSNADEIVDFAKNAGAIVARDDVVTWIKDREEWKATGRELRGYANYQERPQVLTDMGDGVVGATVRGVGNGVLPSLLEEAGAIPDSLGLTDGRENIWNSDRRFADIYSNNLAQNEAITGFDQEAHPYATFGGELAGSLVVPMGRVRSAGDLAKWGAGYGALSGVGQPGTIPERLTSGVVGAGTGLVTTVVGGKLLEAGAPYVAKGVRRVLGKGEAPPVEGAGLDDIASAAPRQRDVIDIGPSEPMPVEPPQLRTPTNNPGPVAGRDRDWIDIADVPPPPRTAAMDAEPMPSVSHEPRRPDYLDLGQPQRMDQPLTEAQIAARAEDVRPSDVTPSPIAASEEWPDGAPDFAGNIRLEKLESPQDIRRALDFTDRRIGFDAATRGRVSNVETERLASELGMTPETLLSRRKGQALNAEEALAARQILAKSGNELVNMAKRVQALDSPGDDVLADFRQAWMRHVAIQEQVAGMTAEAGRALQQFRVAANSRAVRGDVLAGLVRGGGGKENLQDAARVLIDAAEMEPGKFNALAEKITKPTWKNKISELYINFLLSWPQTHAVNITSNTMTALAQIPEHAAAAVVGKARQMLPKAAADRITATELGQRTFGLIQGAKEGAVMLARALKTGEPSDFVAKVEGQEYKAISGLKGEIIRGPTRALTAEDELFKGIARRMELNGLAARQAHREGLKGDAAKDRIAELISNPTDELLKAAEDYGRYVTFQAKLGPAAQDISNFANRHLPMKFFLPFVRTPTNLLKFATERSPTAPFLKEWRNEFRAGGARRDLAVAKMLVGTGFGATIYQAALDDRITGAAPSDPKKSRLLYADGWKPYSIKIGDTYYSYRRLDPFSTTIGVAADLATLPEGMSERQRRDKVTLAVASIMGNLANKTWLSGVSDVVGALADPERSADNLTQRLVGSLLVPNLVAGTARTLDPVQRETETIGDALKSRIPGMRDDLLPRRDIWGNIIKNEGGVGPDFLTPMWTSKALEDPVNKALLPLDYAPGYPSKKVGGRELTPEEYDRYSESVGKASHSALGELIASPEWKGMDDEGKAGAAKKVVDAARRHVRSDMFGSKGAPSPSDDEWSGFTDASPKQQPAKDEWSDFGSPEQRDVIGNLTSIPGITASSFTSGYRTPEYQADMRRRGYQPAENSSHLDGSSLDIRVPAGKTMGWLMREVKRVEPNSRLLPEGDHLHATFPGWYSAPVLGGARAVGLQNPNAI